MKIYTLFILTFNIILLSGCSQKETCYNLLTIQVLSIVDSSEYGFGEISVLRKNKPVKDTISDVDAKLQYYYCSLEDEDSTVFLFAYAYSYMEKRTFQELIQNNGKVYMKNIPDKYWWVDAGDDVASCHDTAAYIRSSEFMDLKEAYNNKYFKNKSNY